MQVHGILVDTLYVPVNFEPESYSGSKYDCHRKHAMLSASCLGAIATTSGA